MSNVQLAFTKFRPNSFITIEDKVESEYFFIIQNGKVIVSKKGFNTRSSSQARILTKGDFFGVVGAMTGHPRMETSKAIDNVSLILVKKNQFGFLIEKNTPLAMKIIRSFSKELRMYDTVLAEKTTKEDHKETPDVMFFSAEYYYKKKKYKAAIYQYSQYVKYFPNRAHVNKSRERLLEIGGEGYKSKEGFERIYQDGEVLFSEGEPGNELFIIQKGSVKITKIIGDQEILIAVLNSGDILGEMALLDDKARVATAISFSLSRVTVVNKDNFNKVVIQNPTLATNLIVSLSERVWTVYKQIANLIYIDPLARFYDTLLTQLMKHHIPIKPQTSYTFPFGIEDLVKMVGFSREEAEKPLQSLLKNKNISIKENQIKCEDSFEVQREVDFAFRNQIRLNKLDANKKHQNII